MRLEEYLRETGTTQVMLAKKLGVAAPRISEWISGSRMPSLRAAIKIWDATNNRVDPRDLLEGHDDARRK